VASVFDVWVGGPRCECGEEVEGGGGGGGGGMDFTSI
jgi:hypothetical protein